jgi:hypothetical protein
MCKIETIFLFLFIFSILGVLRMILKFIVSLVKETDARLYSTGETILFGFFLSYVLTYLLK